MKKFVLALLMLILAYSFAFAVHAAEDTYTYSFKSFRMNSTSDYFTISPMISNDTDQPTDDWLIAAIYDDDNLLLGLGAESFTMEPSESKRVSVEVEAERLNAAYVKLFIWDSLNNLTPLAETYVFEYYSSDNCAIILSVTSNNEVVFLNSDGTVSTHGVTSKIDLSALKDTLTATGNDISKRIVNYQYRPDSLKLSKIEFIGEDAVLLDGEYDQNSGSLGGHRVVNNTEFIDATRLFDGEISGIDNPTNYQPLSKDQLVNGARYTGYVFELYSRAGYVLITDIDMSSAKPVFNNFHKFALATRVYTKYYDYDGNPCDMVKVLYNGEKIELLFKDGESSQVKAGDLFLFETDSDDFVETVYVVYDGTFKPYNTIDGLKDTLEGNWSYSLIDDSANFKYVRGFVVDVDNSSITFADYNANITEIDTNKELSSTCPTGVVTYAYADDANAYVYDLDNEGKFEDGIKVKDPTSIKASNLARFDQDDDGVFTASEGGFANMNAYANEAIAIIVDGDIVAIYVIEK